MTDPWQPYARRAVTRGRLVVVVVIIVLVFALFGLALADVDSLWVDVVQGVLIAVSVFLLLDSLIRLSRSSRR